MTFIYLVFDQSSVSLLTVSPLNPADPAEPVLVLALQWFPGGGDRWGPDSNNTVISAAAEGREGASLKVSGNVFQRKTHLSGYEVGHDTQVHELCWVLPWGRERR